MHPHETFMKKAIEKAREGMSKGQTPFGACIVKEGAVISCVHNVVWETTDITAHAEVHAIREACRALKTIDLSHSVLYSTCEPCPMCFSACHWARISKVIYGAGIQDAQKAGFNELTVSNERMKDWGQSPVEIVAGFMMEECQALFQEWNANASKKIY